MTNNCEICGEPMPEGEQMFKFHGYSGPCPKPATAPVASRPKITMTLAELPKWIERTIETLEDPAFGGAYTPAEIANGLRNMLNVLTETQHEALASPAGEGASSAQGEDWQQRCLDLGFKYWRAPDAHGVECTHEQALALLRDLLGVEVDFTTPPPAPAAEQDDPEQQEWVISGRHDDEDSQPEARGAMGTILAEIARATRKFPTWPTDPLHAVAVVNEEVGELNKALLQAVYEPHKSTHEDVATEAIQAAAMAYRFVASLDRYNYAKCEQHEQPPLAAALAGKDGAKPVRDQDGNAICTCTYDALCPIHEAGRDG